jgi:pimeloyl-ACP methyl ester carboxylesterase
MFRTASNTSKKAGFLGKAGLLARVALEHFRRSIRFGVVAVVSLFALAAADGRIPAADDAAPAKESALADLNGSWLGTIDVGAIKLRLGFVIQAAEGGGHEAKLVSIDQGSLEAPVNDVEAKDGKVSLTVKKIGGTFEGTWNKQAGEIAGEWKQGFQTFPLVLKKVDVLPGLKRPQEPKKPYPYREEEVSFANAMHDVTLKGTLTLPMGNGPFPSLVLISGSGPQNRDEELLGHRPFLVLADSLTRRGIAVLRFDDRDFGKPSDVFQATSEELSEDVLAGVKFLRSRPDIAAAKIGLLGHSEGGLIAPMLAAREKDVAFVVMIAGPGLPGDAILHLQGELLKKHAGVDEATLKKDRVLLQRLYEIVKSEPDNSAAMKRIEAELQDTLSGGDEKAKETAKAIANGQAKLLLTPWFRYFIAYDPRPALTKVSCPVLAVIGEKDSQVPPRDNLPLIEAALKEAGNKDFLVKELPGLNHLLQPAKSGMLDEYAAIETTIDPGALELIGNWIVERTSK